VQLTTVVSAMLTKSDDGRWSVHILVRGCDSPLIFNEELGPFGRDEQVYESLCALVKELVDNATG